MIDLEDTLEKLHKAQATVISLLVIKDLESALNKGSFDVIKTQYELLETLEYLSKDIMTDIYNGKKELNG